MLTGFTHFMSSSMASCWTTILFLLALWQLMPMERRRLFCAAAPLERRGGEFTENSLMAKEEAQQRHNNHDRHGQRTAAMKYLQEFGYLTTPIPTPAEVRNALLVFQDMAGLPNTGELDEPTLEEMQQPRCGNDDLSRAAQRRKRFVYISRWEDKVKDGELRLKWFLQNYTPDMAREDIRKTVRQAFQIWSSQVRIQAMESLSLVFEEANTEEEADIIILWAEGDHGDAHMFDGPGEDGSNILAHTFYPNYQSKGSLNGDIHLDDYEQWHVNSSGKSGGASFPHVLVHEIGHTLGLGHSKKQQAIMFPIYRKERLDQMQLDMDDKCAINWSYVGASDLCLYIWLLSEVLPKRVAPGAEPTSSDKQLSSNMLQQDVWEPVDALKAQLAGRRMPECGTDAEDRMRVQLAELLRRRLSFPQEMAEPYADVLCRFFDGFRQEFGLAGTRHLHRVIRPVGAHSYWQPNDNFAALEQALDRERRRPFDSDFFARLMAMFMGTALSSPVASSR